MTDVLLTRNDDPPRASQGTADEELQDALWRLRAEMRGARLRYRETLYEAASRCVGIAIAVANDPDLWQRFRDLPIWNRGKRKRPPEACDGNEIRWIFRFMDEDNRAAEQRVSKRAIAVETLLSEGVSVDCLAHELARRGGFEKIAANQRRHAPEKHDAKRIMSVSFGDDVETVVGKSSVALIEWTKVGGGRPVGIARVVRTIANDEELEFIQRRYTGGVLSKARKTGANVA